MNKAMIRQEYGCKECGYTNLSFAWLITEQGIACPVCLHANKHKRLAPARRAH